MSFTSDKRIDASVDFFDTAGNIIAQIECLQELFMLVPTKYHKCFTSPINAYLSDSYIQDKTNLVCRCLEEFSLDFLQAMTEMATKTIDCFGRIDLLVASAGLGKSTSERLAPYATASLPYDEWKAILNVNLTGIFLSNRAVLPTMIEQKLGHIINICSSSTRYGLKG